MTEAQEVHTIHVNQTSIIIPDLLTIQSLLSAIISSQTALRGILQQQGSQIMALADDVTALTAQVSTLTTTVSSATAEMDAELAALKTALGASAAASDPAVMAAVTNLSALNAALQAAITRDAPPAGP